MSFAESLSQMTNKSQLALHLFCLNPTQHFRKSKRKMYAVHRMLPNSQIAFLIRFSLISSSNTLCLPIPIT